MRKSHWEHRPETMHCRMGSLEFEEVVQELARKHVQDGLLRTNVVFVAVARRGTFGKGLLLAEIGNSVHREI